MKRTLFAVVIVCVGLIWLWAGASAAPPPSAPSPSERESRDRALAGARVFRDKADAPFDASTVDFSKDPNEGLVNPDLTTCTFLPSEVAGTTPKFDCRLESGEKIKVKYSWTREIPVEVAAMRLLHALGFGAHRMSRVATLRCFGCVVSPFHVRLVAQTLHLGEAFDRHIDYHHAIDFVNVSVERKLKGSTMEAGGTKGFDLYELSKIDPARGGASRAEVDALRLMMMFLNHWDNKGSNQELLCENDQQAPCDHPLAMIHDAGSEFGPNKLNLSNWRKRLIWSDQASCTVSMKGLPYDGATFPDARISEAGRRLLADRLTALSHDQIRVLFTAAGFKDVDGWTAAFEDKVRQIATTPCTS